MLKKMFLGCVLLLLDASAKEIIPLEDQMRIELKQPRKYTFRLKDAESRQVRLHLEARFDWDSLFGYTYGMRLIVNGQPVTGNRLLNKPLPYKTRCGGGNNWAKVDGNSYMIMYSPDFSDKIKTDESFKYGLYEEEQEPYRFVFDLTGLTQHVGTNEIEVSAHYAPLIVRDVKIELDENNLPRINDPSMMIKPAPTGPLPDCQLREQVPVSLKLKVIPGEKLVLTVDGTDYPLVSRFSLPGGEWLNGVPNDNEKALLQKGEAYELTWKTRDYEVKRRLEVRTNYLKIYDTFNNLTDDTVGVAFENSLDLPENPKKVMRGGLDSRLEEIRLNAHPSVLAEMSESCAAIVAEDDILRNQGYYKSSEMAIILGDRNLGLPPRKTHTLEWSVYVLRGNYYDFVNTVRRNWNCNFTLQGVLDFPYMGGGKPLQRWNKKELKESAVTDFLSERPIRMLMTHVASDITVPAPKATPEKPFLGHGTAIRHFSWWGNMTRNMIKMFKQVAPEIKIYAYMHKNLCSEYGHKEKYGDSEARDEESRTLVAKSDIYGRYVPTLNNSYGKELAKNYRYLIDDLDANIYMDEICLSVTGWAPYPEWDGCTVEIDPETHQVVRKLSIPNLLVKPWLEEMIAYLKSRGKELMANGPPVTRTLLNHHYPHFVERGMGEAGLISAHLATPLAWDYSRGIEGFKHFRNSLDFSAVAITWSGPWSLQAFPYTPIELQPGYVIGEERIITRNSGIFGWRDKSEVEIFVYDGQGQFVENPGVQKLVNDGINQFEVRMPSDHVAILVRKQ